LCFTTQCILYNMVRSVARVCSERNVLQKKCEYFRWHFAYFYAKFRENEWSEKCIYEAKFLEKNSQKYFRENFPFRDFFRNFRIFSRNRWKHNFANKVAFFASKRKAKNAKIFAKHFFFAKNAKFSRNDYSFSLQTLSVAPRHPPPHMLVIILICIFMYGDPTHKLLDFLKDFIEYF